MAKAKKSTISVNGVEVTLITQEKGDYICLTDMVRNMEGNAIDYIRNWLRNGSTVEFLGVWEKVHNPNFKIEEFNEIKANYTRNSFLMSVKKWTGLTDAIGMEARKGRYGGTYAHSDIAVQFATWLSPEFYVYLVKEFQRFKVLEAQQNRDTLDWNLKRTLAKVNYRIHTDAVQKHLVPLD